MFKQYDYGNEQENIERYGSKEIPLLDIGNISAELPIALYAGNQDHIADPTDVAWLLD